MQSRHQLLHGDLGVLIDESIIDLLRCDLRHGGGHSARLRLRCTVRAAAGQHQQQQQCRQQGFSFLSHTVLLTAERSARRCLQCAICRRYIG